MFSEDDLLPISALQHLLFCERQCALIHVERLWRDNVLTVEGSQLHHRADEAGPRREVRGDIVILRGVALRSRRLGLTGRADIMELHRVPNAQTNTKTDVAANNTHITKIVGLRGKWAPIPVEYKRGKPKRDLSDNVQLCAQALCAEEMLTVSIAHGFVYYGQNRRRTMVAFDEKLRNATQNACTRLREIVIQGITPTAVESPKCQRCSMLPLCIPAAITCRKSAKQYMQRCMRQMVDEA